MSGPASTDYVPPEASHNSPLHESHGPRTRSDTHPIADIEPKSPEVNNSTNGRVEPDLEIRTKKPEDAVDASPKLNLEGRRNGDLKTVNGHGDVVVEAKDGDRERPAKRRRTRDATTPPPKSARNPKPESPPWKRAAAEGPASYTENGRRKSGRINTVPLEHQPPSGKRLTRRAVNGSQVIPAPKNQTTSTDRRTRTYSSSHNPSQATKHSRARSTSGPTPKSTPKKAVSEQRSATRVTRRRSPSPPHANDRRSTRPRRASRLVEGSESKAPETPGRESKYNAQSTSTRSPRLRLRANRSGTIPLVHADQVRKRPKIGSSFDDFWTRAGDIPVEEGGLRASEDGPDYSNELARRDAKLIARIENEVEPGGILSKERCLLFAPEAEEEPPRQWARQDHMVKAMSNFRRLLVQEQQRHRATAKRIAEACREEWLRRQPKSAEQVEAEARERWIARYRLVVRAMLGTWINVRTEVNRRRLEEWEAEEQRRVKAALNEAVNLSEQRLQARQGADSELLSDEDSFDELSDRLADTLDGEGSASSSNDESSGDDADDSDIMSSDDDEAEDLDDVADEALTQEQLRAKYANVPSLDAPTTESKQGRMSRASNETGEPITDELGESSDNSVDMDEDISSSSLDNDGEETDDGSDSSHGADGLLGMLFGKKELNKMREAASEEPNGVDEDSAMFQDKPATPPDASVNVGEDAKAGNGASNMGHAGSDSHIAESNSSRPNCQSAEASDPHEHAAQGMNGRHQPSNAMSPATDSRDIEMDDPETPGESRATSEGGTALQRESASTKEGQSRSMTPHRPTRKTDVPFLLRGSLREYQHDGLDWLAGLYANSTNGILADEMGLGKTIQTIALLAHLACYHEVWGPHLVVVPTSVMLNWEMEFKKWCPGFKILAYYGSQEERKRKRQGWNNDDVWNVCITSYQLVLQDQQVFKRRRWHYLILDEAHNIKNFKSQRWQTLLGFNTQARLLLTGTPLQNNLTELWSLLFFLMPAENGVGGFADLQEFHDWFQKPESQILESGREQMDDEAKAIISKLHKVLRPYLLRRLKADVEKQMPAKYEHVEFCRLSKRQRELYDGFLARADTRNILASGNYMSIINCLMQLRKVCNHPDLFVDRPIMTSFRMQKSVAAEYQHTDAMIHRRLLREDPMNSVSLGFLNLIPTQHEHLSTTAAERILHLSSNRTLMELREAQKARAQRAFANLDPSTVESNIAYLESAARWSRFEELQHCVYLNALRRQQNPIYGKNLVDLVTVGADQRPFAQRPKVPRKIMAWFEEDSTLLRGMVPSIGDRADSLKTTIEKFSCVTPAVVTRDLEQVVLGRRGIQAFTDEDIKLSAPVRWTPWMPKEPPLDPWHESRMRHSIQFPDKRLLQYDCGKLQVLDGLLRRLQAGGHRALIFTQMTKVLDILEQFLNIHGHKYLRLDGATKVEQRQILTDRFNNDPRILCFILSTRSGGLGINLTGADTVIFYDQDWNPAMDKQCQDRCHRIGQTRDVHIYRLVSEHTIEANILRKASQKQMLDDVVIQEGEFTTDTFNKVSVREVLGEKVDFMSEGVAAADAALDRVLGGPDEASNQRTVGRALEQAEDKEDVTAAHVAEKEIQADDDDFTEKPSTASTGRQGGAASKSVLDGGLMDDAADGDKVEEHNAWGGKMGSIDDFMLSTMAEYLRGTKLELPKDKKKSKKKKGKDTRKR